MPKKPTDQTIEDVEKAIKRLLEEHKCTLVYEEVRRNGVVIGFEIKVVKK